MTEAESASARPALGRGRSFEIDAHFLATVIGAAGDHDAPELRRIFAPLHPADIADTLEQLPRETLETVVKLIGPEIAGEPLAELSAEVREQVVGLLPGHLVSKALSELDTDDAALVAADVEEGRLDEVLKGVTKEDRAALEQSLAFDEETAGRLMQREYVAAPETWSVGQAIDHLRAQGEDLPDRFFEIFVVDQAFHPVGTVALADFLKARRDVPLKRLMAAPQVIVSEGMDQEEVAYAFQKYHLHSAPVVNAAGRLTGMITLDDMVDVIQVENQEDLFALAGVASDSDGEVTVIGNLRARLPWLMVNLGTALAASAVISLFSASLEKLVALAVLMPIVASLGGNTGTQTLAVAVRAIAARTLTPINAGRAVLREGLTGATAGLLFGTVMALTTWLWFGESKIAIAILIAMAINLTCAGLAGILVPLTLRRFGADPAVSSSVFVTFITDLIGFCAFLGIATTLIFVL